ncbi:MAG: methionine adenosyltransferase [Planctomycetota bacterium]|nr:methionine adenosyltransferase [Planctomycetota bacterium]MDI6786926.1 methionine adenosyltransferase [Planctomycetota bacterium]
MKRRARREFTSEAVCMGHPDKICDQISDAILDAIIAHDPTARVAVETMVKTGMAIVAGEITTKTYVEIPDIVRQTIKEIGYTDARMGFDYETCAVLTCIQKQSSDIAMGVDEAKKHHKKLGAGDQGIMFGYACRETPELMPMPIMLARKLVNRAATVRQKNILSYLRPDGKSQVTIDYQDDQPVRVNTVILSLQHNPEIKQGRLRKDLIRTIILPTIPKHLMDKKTRILINPTGRFVFGGPYADCGVTGRKVVVDTYGSMGTHGGGCFSGKDPTKVDRSASYMARYVAKNIVASGLADRVEVQLAYAIGVSEPVTVDVETFGTAKTDEEKIIKLVKSHFDFTPGGIIHHLHLRRPIYKHTARFGHFGVTGPGYTWEKTDKSFKLQVLL